MYDYDHCPTCGADYEPGDYCMCFEVEDDDDPLYLTALAADEMENPL